MGGESCAMQNSPGPQAKHHPKVSSRYLQVIDSLLIAGVKLGPSAKREAINKILQNVPQLTRGDCWQRIRYLRRTPELASVKDCQRNAARLKPPKACPEPRIAPRPWTTADDERLLTYAGYERVDKIAHRLGRSVRAVRFRLGALGMSAKLKDGWSLRSLRNMLHISCIRLRTLIGGGTLRVRDPRISASSLALFCEKNRAILESSIGGRVAATLLKGEERYMWERAADILGVTVAQVQNWICDGQLRVVDTFVTKRSFEEFCKKHGAEINTAMIDPETAKWLIHEYHLPASSKDRGVSRAQKHALAIRICRCGKKIAGNVFFRHVRCCGVATEATRRKPNAATPES